MEIAVNPPANLVKYDAPLFAGLNTTRARPTGKMDAASAKLDDMINSMLPPR